MTRELFQKLASEGHRLPIGTDMALHEKANHLEIIQDGGLLGGVVAEAAQRYASPLAIPLMDLTVEKEAILTLAGVEPADIPTYHFKQAPSAALLNKAQALSSPPTTRMKANVEAVRHVAQKESLHPMGMVIGPFSLMTKMVADPITPVYMAGMGTAASEDESIAAVEGILELGVEMVLYSIRSQASAGAKSILIAEPAANQVYISPKLLAKGSDIFDRYVMKNLQRIRAELDALGVEIFFHCCGELVDQMIAGFCSLNPAALSLGSSRKLWEDAAIVPKEIVLYGNLPSKHFYSDDLTTVESVRVMSRQLIEKMSQAGHPFILGSECDVLSVPGSEQTIQSKIDAFIKA